MSLRGFMLRGSLALAVASLLAACAGRSAATLPAAPGSPATSVTPEAKLRACKGQQTTKQYATVTGTLLSGGGSFCIPKFGGYGGSVKYPGANPSVKLTLTSSTTNYNGMPELGQGTAIFYMQLAISDGTSFAGKVGSGGGLSSKQITAGQTYTVFGQAKIYGFPFNFTPCYVVAVKSRYGATLGGIGTLLKGQRVPAAATGVIEVYEGQQASEAC
ncbi:MAG TPA: hypothetical protein VHR97_00950 [Candidatus Baltobacteraceae bacterium]|nr:hypothetical protein [Candidatus Baltobacteraceae bacterium]